MSTQHGNYFTLPNDGVSTQHGNYFTLPNDGVSTQHGNLTLPNDGVSTQHGHLHQSVVTTNRVTYFLLRASTGNCVSHSEREGGGGGEGGREREFGKMKVNEPVRSKLG